MSEGGGGLRPLGIEQQVLYEHKWEGHAGARPINTPTPDPVVTIPDPESPVKVPSNHFTEVSPVEVPLIKSNFVKKKIFFGQL